MVQSMWDKSSTASTDQSSIDTSIATLKKYGLYAEPKKKKLGVLSRIGLLLNAFSPTTAAYGSMYEGKNFVGEYAKNAAKSVASAVTAEDNGLLGQQKSTKDILIKQGMKDVKGKLDATDILGFAGDVLTDPTTYLTAGLAKGGTKIFAEGGKAINLSKAGTKALEEFAQKAGTDMTREAVEKAFAKTIVDAPNMLAKRGIRLAGQTIVPGSALDKIGLGAVADKGLVSGGLSAATTGATHLPFVGKKVGTVVGAAQDLFDPLAGIKRAMPQQSEYIDNLFKSVRRGTEGEQSIAAKQLTELADKAYKLDPEAGAKITRVIEAGRGITPEAAAEVTARQAAANGTEVAGKTAPVAEVVTPKTNDDVTRVMESFNKKVKDDLSSEAYYTKSHADKLNKEWNSLRGKRKRAEASGNKELARELSNKEDEIFPRMREYQQKVADMKKSGADISSAAYDKSRAGISVKVTEAANKLEDGVDRQVMRLRSDDVYNGTYTKEGVGLLKGRGIINSADEKILLDNLRSIEKKSTKQVPEAVATVVTKTAKEITPLQQIGKDLGKKKAEITALVKKRDNLISKVTDNPKQIDTLTKAYKKKTDALIAEKRILEENYARIKQGQPIIGAAPAVGAQEGLARGTIDIAATTGNKELDDIAMQMKSILEQTHKADLEKGIATGKIENYVHRMTTPEATDMLNSRGINVESKLKEYSTKFKAQKSRVQQEQFISDINAKFKQDFGVEYNLFEEDAFKSTLKREFDSIRAGNNAQLGKTINTELGVTKDVLDPTGKYQGIQYVPSADGKIYIPKEVSDVLNKVKNIGDDKSLSTFLNMYDKGLKFWKGSVTRYFPSFHARNFLGASFNNWLAGVDNPMRYVQAARIVGSSEPGYIVSKNGTRYTYEWVREQLQKSGVLGQTGMFDVNKNLSDISGSIGKTSKLGKITKPAKVASDKAFQSVEDEVRSTLFIDRLIKGDSVNEASNQVFKYHFDYSPEAYTHFENSVLKRVAPFYSWTKGNVPLQLEQLGKQPGKYAAIMKVKSMFDNERVGQTDEEGSVVTRQTIQDEKALEPEYMQNQYTLSLGKGKTLQVPLPVEDLTRMKPKEAYAMLAPFIKMPFELVANKNIYMDTEIANKALPKELQTTKTIISPKYMTPQMRKFFNATETTITDPSTGEEKKQYEMDSTKMYLIRSLAGRLYSTVEDATKGDKAFKDKAVKFATGLGAKETDLGKQEYYAALDKNAQLSEMTKYFRAKGKMPTAEEEKATAKSLKLISPKKGKYAKARKIKKVKFAKTSTQKKQAKAKALMASAKRNK